MPISHTQDTIGAHGRTVADAAAVLTAIAAIAHAGATIIDNLNITALESPTTGASEFNILLFDFKSDVAAYLATRSGGPKTLQDLIDFNTAHAAQELKFIPTLPT